MKKIIVLFNGISAPWHITTFAINFAKQNNAEVHALFLKDEIMDYPYLSDITSVQKEASTRKERTDNTMLEEKNIELFKTFCDDENVSCFFERDISLKKLINFSVDAHVVIADSHDEFQKYSLNDILAGVKCPVCLISANATEIKTSILLYDGRDDAKHAIDAYAGIFPKLCLEKGYVLTINEGNSAQPLSSEALQNFLQKFPKLEIVSLKGNLEKKLIEFLDEHTENTMVVMGAYGRSAISRLFKPSLSNVVLNQSRTSLFIAHD